MKSLISRFKALVSSSDKSDIHKASRNGALQKVMSILSKDSSLINAKDKDGLTPLQLAAKQGRVEVCRYLLDKGANLNAGSGFSPLHYAAWKGHLEVVELVINKGSDINARTSGGRDTPLHAAVLGGNYEIAELLLEKGADVSAKNALGDTPLADAERKGKADIVALLKGVNR